LYCVCVCVCVCVVCVCVCVCLCACVCVFVSVDGYVCGLLRVLAHVRILQLILLLQSPLYLLVVFGCYALASIGYELFVFRDCDAAAAELSKVCSVRERRVRVL
jgi:Dolichol-phosphate mannosyltransferase subunit 3 (DPM3)